MGTNRTDGLVRIAYAEDDLSILQLVSRHIDSFENCKVVIKVTDGQSLLDKLKENPAIDLALLDVMMDGLDGYIIAAEIKKNYPSIRILFYSQLKTELALTQMICCGGHGLVRKGISLENLKKGIRTVMKGRYFFTDCNGDVLQYAEPVQQLTDTEISFLKYAASDLTYKQIACKMKKTERQVDYLRETLFKKCNVQSRVGLILYTVQSGIKPTCCSFSPVG